MEEIASKFTELNALINTQGQIDVDKCSNIIKELKIKMTAFPFLTSKEEEIMSPKDRQLFRSIYENMAKFYVITNNLPAFDRVMEKLRICYHQSRDLEPSSEMELFSALYLVYLLSQNKIVEFNIEFDAVVPLIGDGSEFLQYAHNLHQAINDNSFSKIYVLKSNPPSELFHNITAGLVDGARQSHAESIEKAYQELTIMELSQILHFSNFEDAIKFAEKRGWLLNDHKDMVSFKKNSAKPTFSNSSMVSSIDLCVAVSTLD